jgi:hypothetical protein
MEAWMQNGAGFSDNFSRDDRLDTTAKSGDAYFSFVESMDEFGSFDEIPKPPEWLKLLNLMRRSRGLPDPKWVVWLDCIRAGYFLDEVTWRDEPCEINNREQGSRRRERIASFEPGNFRVAATLLSDQSADEAGTALQFARASWHRITLGNRVPGIPAAMGEDFDLDAAAREEIQIGYFGGCPLEEHLELLKVFNLNFIGDARWDDEGGTQGPKGRPAGPKDWQKSWGGGGGGKKSQRTLSVVGGTRDGRSFG